MSVRVRLAAALIAVAASASMMSDVRADDELEKMIHGKITGSVTGATDYTYRGISQTSENPAIQGALEYLSNIGLYAGVWASNVKFTDATIEVDWTAGYRGEFNGITYDIGGIYYYYPGTASGLNYDFGELALKLGYDFKFAALTVGFNYSPEFFADSGHAQYYSVNIDVPLPYEFMLNLHGARQNIENNARFGSPDYYDWSIGVSREVYGFGLSLAYIDTDLSRSECANTGNCGARALFSVTKKF